jgi:alkylhydroperoxidase/carboxymuconolactone decarboxylase family protein YurZ
MGVDLGDVAREAAPFLAAAADGRGLDDVERVLVRYGIAASPTALEAGALSSATDAALAAGVDEAVLVEVLTMVSAVGVHALHEGVIALERRRPATDAGHRVDGPLGQGSTYWRRFEAELPGFLDGLAGRSAWAYDAFIRFAGAPAQHGRLDRLTRELVYIAVDATPTHRYLPGMRFHLENAVALGATRAQLVQTLAAAAHGPAHAGVAAHRSAERAR